jgi:DNA-binding GntR family transcriptional regulator
MATKSEEAYKKILKLLFRRHFEKDNRFSVRELAKILNMSVVPISEAIRRLQQQGLILCQPRRKIRIRVLSTREMQDVMLVREALECQAAGIVAQLADPKTIDDLMAKAGKVDHALAENDVQAIPDMEFEFHVALARASKSKLLAEKVEEMAMLTLLCAEPVRYDFSTEIGKHPDIVKAIATGKPETAEEAMKLHLKGMLKYTEILDREKK